MKCKHCGREPKKNESFWLKYKDGRTKSPDVDEKELQDVACHDCFCKILREDESIPIKRRKQK